MRWLIICTVAAWGCSSTHASDTIGPTGGRVTAAGATLTIPPGALTAAVHITITATNTPVAGYALSSPLYQFAPAGLPFAKAVGLTVDVTPAAAAAVLYWSNATGGYDALPTTHSGNTAQGTISHFSSGFAGTAVSASNDLGAGADLGSNDDLAMSLPLDGLGAPDLWMSGTSDMSSDAGPRRDLAARVVCAPNFVTGGAVTGNPVAVADFDGNQHLDLLLADAAGFSIAFGNGDGTFAAPSHAMSMSAGATYDVVDFDGNGVPDLFVSWGSRFQALLGSGDGSFSPAPMVSPSPGALAIAAGEFTGDKKADVIIGYNSVLIGLELYPGVGDGTFGPIVTTKIAPTGTQGFTTLVKQRGKNGHDAYAYATRGAGGHTVYSMSGHRCSPGTLDGPLGPNTLLSGADFDGDGLNDVVVDLPEGRLAGAAMTSFGVLLLTGNSCSFPSEYADADGPAILLGDFNGDGLGDVVVGGNRLMCGNGDGTLEPPVAFTAGSTIQGDFDGDARNDYIAVGVVYLNRN